MNKSTSRSSLTSNGGGKKQRRKLDISTFEWTDDAISKFEIDHEIQSKGSNALFKEIDGVPQIAEQPEDMDHKIARVQYRKKEEEERQVKIEAIKAALPMKTETVLSGFVPNLEDGTAS